MAPDAAQHHGQGVVALVRQRVEAQEQLAGLPGGQRADRDLVQVVVAVRDGVAARDQELAAVHGLHQPHHACRCRVVGLAVPARHAQVVFEVVEHQQDPLCLQQAAHERLSLLVVAPRVGQPLGWHMRRVALEHRRGQLAPELAQAERSGDRDDHPILFAQAGHDAPGERALAHAADAGQAHPLALVPQHPQRPPQERSPAHQVADAKLRHGPGHGRERGALERLLVEIVVDDGGLGTAAEERGGRVLGLPAAGRVAVGAVLGALGLEHPPRHRQRPAGGGTHAQAQLAVERARQLAGVSVAHPRLHRQHHRHAALEQAQGQADGLAVTGATVARRQEHQRQRPSAVGDGVGQRRGRGRDGPALFVLELDDASAAVPRQVQHVVLVAGQGSADLVRVTDFEEGHLRGAELHPPLDRVEDELDFVLEVQRCAAALTFVWRPHGDQDLERPGQPGLGVRAGGRPQPRRAPQHVYGRSQRHHLVAQPRRLPRQRQQGRVVGLYGQLEGRARCGSHGLQLARHRARHLARVQQVAELRAQAR